MSNERNRLQNKQRVLECALTLFYEKGIANTKICEIAHKAGLTSTSVYRYYKNKDELVFAVANYFAAHFYNGITQHFLQFDYDALTGLQQEKVLLEYVLNKQYFQNKYLIFLSELEFYLHKIKQKNCKLLEQLKQLPEIHKAKDLSISVIKKGMQDGTIRNDIPAEQLLQMISVALHGFMQLSAKRYFWFMQKENEPMPENFANTCKEMILNYIKK